MRASDAAAGPTEPTFDLLAEPWLPVHWLDGRRGGVGLRELFLRSREIAGLAETSPTSYIALHRMLLALTHRALTLHCGRWRDSDRARWYREGLPAEAFDRYFETWSDRFWLFHPTHPFMQVAALAQAPQTQEAKPWTQVALARTTGNSPVVFEHSFDRRRTEVEPSAALADLLGYLQFVQGSLVRVLRTRGEDGALFNTLAVMPLGENLNETLCLALHPPGRAGSDELEDQPSWEATPPGIAQLIAAPRLATGPNDRYTRLVRAVLFERAGSSTSVSGVRFAEGLDFPKGIFEPDPMTSYEQREKGPVALKLREGRAVWRDLAALLPTPIGHRWRRAAALGWGEGLLQQLDQDDGAMRVCVAGMACETTRVKPLDMRLERFHLPKSLATNADLGASISAELDRAEQVYRSVRQLATAMYAAAAPDPKGLDSRKRAASCIAGAPIAPTFFARAERGLASLLAATTEGNAADAHATWSATVLEAARAAWSAACTALGDSPAALRARALHEGRFVALLHREHLLPAPIRVKTEETTT